jgi:nucleotide-binding universal stress UspA family protein
MKTIFLLTNFTKASEYAIEQFIRVYGQKFASQYQFILLNAWHQPKTGQSQMIKLDDTLQEISQIDLKKQLYTLNRLFSEINLNILSRSEKGEVVPVVNRLSETYDPDLIVLGTKGSNLLREILIGSTTGRILRKAKAPVLMIPESVRFARPEKIVFITDLEVCEKEGEFKKLTDLARAFMSEFIVLHIYKDEKPDYQLFEACMEKYLTGINYAFIYQQHLHPVEGISEYAHNINADMLALILKDSRLLAHILKYHVNSKLTQRAELPMLILHE